MHDGAGTAPESIMELRCFMITEEAVPANAIGTALLA